MATAAFVKSEQAPQGTWKGVYGADGYFYPSSSTTYYKVIPAYFDDIRPNGGFAHVWEATTADVRALEKPNPATDRIASTQFLDTTHHFELLVKPGDVRKYQVAVYSLDWTREGRDQQFDIVDHDPAAVSATSGQVLDTRRVPAFGDGVWVVWTITGSILVRVTDMTGSGTISTAVAGLFIGVPAAVRTAPVIKDPAEGASISLPYTTTWTPGTIQ